MNIFILNEDPVLAAKDHCDKHVVKMILESAQMLSSAHWIGWKEKLLMNDVANGMKQRQIKQLLKENVPQNKQPAYSMTHVNHPCTVWARETKTNYLWLCSHSKALCEEYTRRYGRRHKSEDVIDWLTKNIPPHLESCEKGQTPFAQAMPDEHKDENPVTAYRNYYVEEKMKIAKWNHSHTPGWFLERL